MTLEQLVDDFREAVADGRQADAMDRYNLIHLACGPSVRQVHSNYRNLGTFVVDIADEKLHDCLATFRSGRFYAYYRGSLVNAANDECRRRKRFKSSEDLEESGNIHVRTIETPAPGVLEARMKIYAMRKRKLIDTLTLRPAKISTLLLDQRRRMAEKTGALVDANDLGKPSTLVEEWEWWHTSDEPRPYDGINEPCILCVWDCFGEKLNAAPGEVSHRSMVLAIEEAGGGVASEAWRQRVCRYLEDVREQVTEPEWLLFHA